MKYLASIEDLAPLSDQIKVRGDIWILVDALSLDQIGALIYRHSAFKEAIAGGEQGDGLYEAILAGGKSLVQDLVDAATGKPGLGGRLAATDQGRIILSCLNMTLPSDDDEVADFLEQFLAFASRASRMARVAKAKGLMPKA